MIIAYNQVRPFMFVKYMEHSWLISNARHVQGHEFKSELVFSWFGNSFLLRFTRGIAIARYYVSILHQALTAIGDWGGAHVGTRLGGPKRARHLDIVLHHVARFMGREVAGWEFKRVYQPCFPSRTT